MTKKRKRGQTPSIPQPKVTPKSRSEQAAPEDDKALWQAFTQNIDPLNLKRRVPETDNDMLGEMLWRETSKAGSTPSSKPSAAGRNAPKSKALSKSLAKPLPDKPAPAPQVNHIDSRQVRRIGNGRDSIDARIDLHGMRQREAHSALRAFLYRSVSKGHRMVLVITGKGQSSPNDEHNIGSFINEGALGRGVLRRNVPLWLSEPDLRSIVVGHTPAHIRHGGDGALYVQLRRRK